MRFPWLQVDADFIGAKASDLGAHLNISRREAMGLALDLWTWALARAPDDAPPDGVVTGAGPVPDRLIAGSVGWTGSAEAFTAALVSVGLAVRLDGGYRLAGFSRYKATWEKNRRRAGTRPEQNRTGAGGDAPRKTQTQNETTSAGSPPSAGGSQATLVSVPASEPERPKRRPTVPHAVSDWYEAAKAKREASVPSTAPDNSALRPDQWAKLGEALKLHGQKAMDAALAAFFADAYARDRHYPLGLFVGQCAKYQSEASAQQARGGARVGGETSDERAARLRAETWAKIQADKQAKAAGGGA